MTILKASELYTLKLYRSFVLLILSWKITKSKGIQCTGIHQIVIFHIKKKKEGKNEKKDIKYSTMGCCLNELD